MDLIVDPEDIYQLATRKEKENFAFEKFLESQNSSEIDEIVHRLNAEISDRIDCLNCGNCCRVSLPDFSLEDLQLFTKGIKMNKDEFIGKYLCKSRFEPDVYVFNIGNNRCPFQKYNLCKNYKFRPKGCRDYPHLHEDDFLSRIRYTLYHTSLCPIIYNVVEGLKIETEFIYK